MRVANGLSLPAWLATLISPYTLYIYKPIWLGATRESDWYFAELHSMRFREPQDYILMMLVMSAFLVLGRSRTRDVFQILLLILSAAISFRFHRDTWVVVLAAVGIIADALRTSDAVEVYAAGLWKKLVTAVLVLVVLAAAAYRVSARRGVLTDRVAAVFPVRGAEYIARNHLWQPLFQCLPLGRISDMVSPRVSRGDGRAL